MWRSSDKVTYLKNYYICNNKLMIYISEKGTEPIGELLDYMQRFETKFDKIVLYDPDFINKERSLLMINYLFFITISLLVLKLCGVAITWTQVCIPLFLIFGIFASVLISVVAFAFGLLHKYGRDETQNMLEEIEHILERFAD